MSRCEPTPDLVRGLWAAMAHRWGTRAVSKADSAQMRALSKLLDAIGVLDATSFMRRYTTVVGRTIYCPFELGVPSASHPLWAQLVVGVHEHQHVVQLEREGRVGYSVRYVASRSARATWEAEAYTCNLELHWWRYGVVRDASELARRLQDYGLGRRDVEAAEAVLRGANEQIARGEVVTEAGRFALDWLDLRAPALADRLTSTHPDGTPTRS